MAAKSPRYSSEKMEPPKKSVRSRMSIPNSQFENDREVLAYRVSKTTKHEGHGGDFSDVQAERFHFRGEIRASS